MKTYEGRIESITQLIGPLLPGMTGSVSDKIPEHSVTLRCLSLGAATEAEDQTILVTALLLKGQCF